MVTLKVTELFFDRAKVRKAADAAKLKVYARIGAFVRGVSRRSLRQGKKPSQPGQPPHLHSSSSPLKRLLFFSRDQRTDTVVVGPAALRNSPVPNVLEFGGTERTPRSRRKHGAKPKIVIAKRPYMGPALHKARDAMPGMWEGSIRG